MSDAWTRCNPQPDAKRPACVRVAVAAHSALTMSASRTWVRARTLASSHVNGEIVLLDGASGDYFGLNEVAACVWDSLERPRRLDELVEVVCARYEVPREQCARDVEALLSDLVRRGLAEPSSGP